MKVLFAASSFLVFVGTCYADYRQPKLKCDGIWEVDETVPFVEGCPLVIMAHPKDGPIEIRHLSRATLGKCAFEDVISNAGPSNQIVCRVVNK